MKLAFLAATVALGLSNSASADPAAKPADSSQFSTTLAAPRIPPVPPEQWTPAIRDMFAIIGGPQAKEKGTTSPLLLFLANNPELGSRFLTFATPLLRGSSLPSRLREMVVLRVAWRTKCEYEWGHHVTLSQQAGVKPAEIVALQKGDYASFPEDEAAALHAVDELGDHSQIDDATWGKLTKHLQTQQQMDLLFTIGSYTMMGWAANVAGVRIEKGEVGLDWTPPK